MAPFDVRSKCTGTGFENVFLEKFCSNTFDACRKIEHKEQRDYCEDQATSCAEEIKKGSSSFALEPPNGLGLLGACLGVDYSAKIWKWNSARSREPASIKQTKTKPQTTKTTYDEKTVNKHITDLSDNNGRVRLPALWRLLQLVRSKMPARLKAKMVMPLIGVLKNADPEWSRLNYRAVFWESVQEKVAGALKYLAGSNIPFALKNDMVLSLTEAAGDESDKFALISGGFDKRREFVRSNAVLALQKLAELKWPLELRVKIADALGKNFSNPEKSEILFKNAMSILRGDDKKPGAYRWALSSFNKVSGESPRSDAGRYASLLKDAMERSSSILSAKITGKSVLMRKIGGNGIGGRPAAVFEDAERQDHSIPSIKVVYKNKNFSIQKFKAVDGLSLVFFKERPLEPAVIPGTVKVKRVRGRVEIQVPEYFGKFSVIFKDPEKMIPENSAALLEAYRILPNGFFEGFKRMVFTGVRREDAEGEYAANIVTMYKSSDPLGTIVHELAHHWDLSVAVGTDGKDLGLGDPSRLFYDISWTPEKIKCEIEGRDHEKVPMDRHDFDKEAFAYEYGMCNRREDLATMADYYVTRGRSLRCAIREQMAKGKFELAAKYLFVKYIMPFRTREYRLEGDPLGFEEVKKSMNAWLKDHVGTVAPNTIDAIKKIENKYEEIKYK